VRFEGSVSHQRFGLGMVVMDLDGDAYDDLVVGSSVHPLETGEGELFVFFGHP
jgi:hypothetical protein